MSMVALIGLLGCISPNIQVGSPNSEPDTGNVGSGEILDTGDTDTQDSDTNNVDTDDTAVEDLDGDGVSAGEDCDDNDATVSSSCVPQTGLFAEYLLNEGVGQVLNDNSGNLYSGFIGDSTGTDSYDASWSNGFLSTSSSACATIENINFTQAGPYTIHVAVRSASNQTHSTPRMISFRGTDSSGSNTSIQYSTYGSQLTIDRHTNYSSQTSLNPLDGDWHLVSYVENGSAYSVYVDGVLDFSSTINNPFTWGTMQKVILGGARCGNDHFNGDFAYLSLYDVAQSSAELFETYTDIRDTLMIQGVTLPDDIDADGDGYLAWQDCDDTDSTVAVLCCNYATCDENLDLGGGQSMDIVLIPSGADPLGRYTITSDFYLMTTEVTQGMFTALMSYDPTTYSTTYGVGSDYPAYYVNWHMAADFANQVTQRHNSVNGTSLQECYTCTNSDTTSVTCTEAVNPYQCTGYSLPTEGEWEYAARSGTQYDFWTPDGGGDYSSGICDGSERIQDDVNNPLLRDYAWYCGNNNNSYGTDGSKEVGQKLPNGFGLYDMHGNMFEWNADWYGCNFPQSSTNPYCDSVGSNRTRRGGDWDNSPAAMYTSFRYYDAPTYRYSGIGFRLGRHP